MRPAQLASSYKSVAVSSATPGQLVLMLFDGALRFLATAAHGFEQANIAARNEQIHNNLVKTQKILRELQCSLDLKTGGEFAKTMFALYEFMLDQLQAANLAKDAAPIGVVERLLGEIRGAWAQMLEQAATVPA
ncbi:MAG: flagellar export chaperone FliS [Chthoniobacter sp.]|nr:flagellar export chaperone FliS [Chthoniobacter sp.]